MHDAVDILLAEKRANQLAIGNVAVDEAIIGVVLDRRQRGEVARIGQLVEIDDACAATGHQQADHRGTDKSGPAGDEDGSHQSVLARRRR